MNAYGLTDEQLAILIGTRMADPAGRVQLERLLNPAGVKPGPGLLLAARVLNPGGIGYAMTRVAFPAEFGRELVERRLRTQLDQEIAAQGLVRVTDYRIVEDGPMNFAGSPHVWWWAAVLTVRPLTDDQW